VITGTVRIEEQMFDNLGQSRAKRSGRTQGGDTDHSRVCPSPRRVPEPTALRQSDLSLAAK
jgi:hypothetical protein